MPYAVSVSLGALIRDSRQAHGWSQSELAARLCDVSGQPSLTREEIARWERGKVIPGPFWLGYLAGTLEVPGSALAEQARLSRVSRRQFLNLSALTAVHGKLASELVGAIGAADAGALMGLQTPHGTDLVIASLADRSAVRTLHRWMLDGSNAVLRVNATGILAKFPQQRSSDE